MPKAGNAPTTGDDAALLQLCAAFAEADRVVRRWGAGKVSEAEGEAALDWWHALAGLIAEWTARTAAGRAAKARAGVMALLSIARPGGGFAGIEEALALSALRDVAGPGA